MVVQIKQTYASIEEAVRAVKDLRADLPALIQASEQPDLLEELAKELVQLSKLSKTAGLGRQRALIDLLNAFSKAVDSKLLPDDKATFSS